MKNCQKQAEKTIVAKNESSWFSVLPRSQLCTSVFFISQPIKI